MSVKVFVDSTTLLYAKDRLNPLKLGAAATWLAALEKEDAVVVSGQVLREFYNVLTKPNKHFKFPRAAARMETEDLFVWLPEAPIDDRFEDAWLIQDRYGFSWFDSLLLAAAIHAGCAAYITEDLQDGQMIGGLRIVNPFRNDPTDTLAALRTDTD